MRADIEERCLEIGKYICETKKTIRAAAKVWGISKSTCHKDLVERLPKVDSGLAERVREILAYHKAQRHILGGKATAKMWLNKKENS
ncbi:MAG: sporulation transcriptional regulator SpoIIID [Clostridia bacterium]|nr:sporulation transcriptional regulator SpoIIID [Clostridia bacterium]